MSPLVKGPFIVSELQLELKSIFSALFLCYFLYCVTFTEKEKMGLDTVYE